MNARHGLADDGTHDGVLTSQLSVSNSSNDEVGLYRCIVTTTCGSTVSDAATLAICIGDSDRDHDADLDGDTDSDDITIFFASWDAGC